MNKVILPCFAIDYDVIQLGEPEPLTQPEHHVHKPLKVAAASWRPKGLRVNWNNPFGVVKVVFFLS